MCTNFDSAFRLATFFIPNMIQYAGYMIPVFQMKRWLFWIVSFLAVAFFRRPCLTIINSTTLTLWHMVRSNMRPLSLILLTTPTLPAFVGILENEFMRINVRYILISTPTMLMKRLNLVHMRRQLYRPSEPPWHR